ncbi:MAG: DUF1080 domain-containing protein [Acidobacteria bacterium]|nr:MAG: DUF1080 domain-containing protein [Acidobacteriota bacterium]
MDRRDFLGTAAALPLTLQQQAPGEADFKPLFDGKSLAGWIITEGPESAFYVDKGDIVSSASSGYPAWLRSTAEYENFDFRCEFFIRGWMDGGVYFHAPEHGRPGAVGKQLKIFHQQDKEPRSNSMGSIFPLIAPTKVVVKNQGEWNDLRILADWPRLLVWVNGESVQDLNVENTPELKTRPRSGYLGLSGLSYPLHFRNLRIRELPSKETWEELYRQPTDIEQWSVSESSRQAPARFLPLGAVIRAEGAGHLATKKQYRDFELQLYVRGPREHNGGILIRSEGKGLSGSRYYEIQIHNVEEAHYPTGSLYFFKRSVYPRIADDTWFPMQIRAQGPLLMVRVNGDTVLDYDRLENVDAGHIELQAHQPGSWLEFKRIRVKEL